MSKNVNYGVLEEHGEEITAIKLKSEACLMLCRSDTSR